MFLTRIFEFSRKKLIRNINSLSADIISSCIKAKRILESEQYLNSLILNKAVRVHRLDNQISSKHYGNLIYPSDIESFMKLCSIEDLFATVKLKCPGNIIIPNRLSIQFDRELSNYEKSLFDKYPNKIIDLEAKKLCILFCEEDDDFNSIFFMNQPNGLDVQRATYPYIKSKMLKRTPNILSVFLPSSIDSIPKAEFIFSDFEINRIIKPSSTGTWHFYMANEKSYIKMLSTPTRYRDELLVVTPYYGTPLIYSPGEKAPGKMIHIYCDKKLQFKPDFMKFNGFHRWSSEIFEHNQVISFYFKNMDDYNRLKFSNGLDMLNGNKYTMVLGDEISGRNILSPYLFIIIKDETEVEPIVARVKHLIHTYQIKKPNNETYLILAPKSIKEYTEITNMEFQVNGESRYFYPEYLSPKKSFLDNSIIISQNFYNENKHELTNKAGIKADQIDKINVCIIFCEVSKLDETLFYLSNLSPEINTITRSSRKQFDPLKKIAFSSSKRLKIISQNFDEACAQTRNLVPAQDFTWKNNQDVFFNNIHSSHPFLFKEFRIYGMQHHKGVNYVKTETDESILSVKKHVEIPQSLIIKHSLNITPIKSDDTSIYYSVELKSLHDLANIICFADNFTGLENVKFLPGNNVFDLTNKSY